MYLKCFNVLEFCISASILSHISGALWMNWFEAISVLLCLTWTSCECLVLCLCRSWFFMKVFLIGRGSLFCIILYMNLPILSLYRSFRPRRFSSLYRGVVWSLYLEFVIVLMAFFWMTFSLLRWVRPTVLMVIRSPNRCW